MKTGYYLECANRQNNGLLGESAILEYGNNAHGMYAKLEELTAAKTYDHITVRHYNGWLHELIGEWFRTDKKVFYYDTYAAFQAFNRELGGILR